MPHNIDERQWVDRFMDRLRELVADLKAADAVAHASELYDAIGSVLPETAAEEYADAIRRPTSGTLH